MLIWGCFVKGQGEAAAGTVVVGGCFVSTGWVSQLVSSVSMSTRCQV
jgi:hypothetical protein